MARTIACGEPCGALDPRTKSEDDMRPGSSRTGQMSSGDLAYDLLETFGDARQLVVVDLVRGIAGQVIVGVAEEGCVSRHDRRETELMEGPVVGPADARNDVGGDAANRGKGQVLAERADNLM